jgi:hypothetical protein
MQADPLGESSQAVDFTGPFSWTGTRSAPAIADAEIARRCGVYLWTVHLDQGELVYYVGETGRSFRDRMSEHFREHMSGGYHLYEPSAFREGRKDLLWPGRFGPTGERSVRVFLERFPELAEAMAALAEIYRFYLAPLDCDRRLRERIESALANCLYEQPGLVGEFQDRGINYRTRWDSEEPIRVQFYCNDVLLGLPESLWV